MDRRQRQWKGLSTVPGTEKAFNERYMYIHRLPLFKLHYLPTPTADAFIIVFPSPQFIPSPSSLQPNPPQVPVQFPKSLSP